MKALVKFITTGVDELTSWDCSIGRAYLEATHKKNPVPALCMGLYEDAARGDWNNADEVWSYIQNGAHAIDQWINVPGVECLTKRPRSMMVGDIVIFEDGGIYMVAGLGWVDLSEGKKS